MICKTSASERNHNKVNMIKIQNIAKYYHNRRFSISKLRPSLIRAIDDISFEINENETLGLVGESGCGKSTLGKVILRLTEPDSGNVFFNDIDITKLRQEEVRKLRPKMQMVFQDSYSSLNPRFTIGDIIAEPCDIHTNMTKAQKRERVLELLELVNLKAAHAARYSHELSEGQRQRVNIARALALNPRFIVCDEPISALDVSVQAQVVNLLKDLQLKLGLTYLFISHDLSMVRYISDRIAVMYLGKIVEFADSKELFENPLHPYTMSLISSIPIPDPKKERKRKPILLKSEASIHTAHHDGCIFYKRCPFGEDICGITKPEYNEVSPRHHVACHFAKSWEQSKIDFSCSLGAYTA